MPAVPFAEVLDRLIEPRPGSSSTTATAGIRTRPFSDAAVWPCFEFSRWQRSAIALEPVRPRRILTASQRTALNVLRHAGAAQLSDDFLTTELKSAFRQLARRLHPDMHPNASPAARRQLSTEFRDVRDAYQLLVG